jgi:hypothetical protein
MATQVCANCGLAASPEDVNAGLGYSLGGKTYCCAACSRGEDCDCAERAHASPQQVAAVREKQASAIGPQAEPPEE